MTITQIRGLIATLFTTHGPASEVPRNRLEKSKQHVRQLLCVSVPKKYYIYIYVYLYIYIYIYIVFSIIEDVK